MSMLNITSHDMWKIKSIQKLIKVLALKYIMEGNIIPIIFTLIASNMDST